MFRSSTTAVGPSLLDASLLARASPSGVVRRPVSRLLLVGETAAGRSPALCAELARVLGAHDPETTGFLLVHSCGAFWGLAETSPEAAVAVVRLLARPAGAAAARCRIVAQVEDCAQRACASWSYSAVADGAAAATDAELLPLAGRDPVCVAARLYSAALGVGASTRRAREAGVAAPAAAAAAELALPAAAAIRALAEWEELTSCAEWLELFGEPPDIVPLDEEALPDEDALPLPLSASALSEEGAGSGAAVAT